MPFRKALACVIVCVGGCGVCSADWISEWGGNSLGVDYDVTLSDLAILLTSFGLSCPCSGNGFARAGGGESEENQAFVEWVRQASPFEILEWYEQWQRSSP